MKSFSRGRKAVITMIRKSKYKEILKEVGSLCTVTFYSNARWVCFPILNAESPLSLICQPHITLSHPSISSSYNGLVIVAWYDDNGLIIVAWYDDNGLVIVAWYGDNGLVIVAWCDDNGLVIVAWYDDNGLVIVAWYDDNGLVIVAWYDRLVTVACYDGLVIVAC